jgi:hypothetical protein
VARRITTVSSPVSRAARGPDRFEPGEAEHRDTLDIRAQLIEVTPDKQVVLDVRIGGEAGDPKALSVFRSEFVPA